MKATNLLILFLLVLNPAMADGPLELVKLEQNSKEQLAQEDSAWLEKQLTHLSAKLRWYFNLRQNLEQDYKDVGEYARLHNKLEGLVFLNLQGSEHYDEVVIPMNELKKSSPDKKLIAAWEELNDAYFNLTILHWKINYALEIQDGSRKPRSILPSPEAEEGDSGRPASQR